MDLPVELYYVGSLCSTFFFLKDFGIYMMLKPFGLGFIICVPVLLPFAMYAQKLSSLEESLCKVETSDPAIVSAIIDKYSEQPFLKEDSVYHRLVCISIYICHKHILSVKFPWVLG